MNADTTIRVLVVDDERPMREAYQEVLTSRRRSEAESLRARLFGDASAQPDTGPSFEVHTADCAEAAVQVVRDSKESGRGFDVVFLDMRMPPGPDGAWAATQIRSIEPEVDIVIATAYSDVDPEELARRIPPADKLFYLQKPFHAHEVRQLAVALGRKARAEAHTRQLAYFDSLTGLANRDLARERICAAVESAKEQARSLAVMFIDLDNFKRINDTLGHDVGDEILKATAARLCATLRESDTVAQMPNQLARMGGDEFVLLLPNVARPDDATVVAERIIRSLSEPIRTIGHELTITPSIGVALYPADGEDLETLLRNADLAMYFAKRSGRSKFKYYDATMNATALKRLTMECQLRGALTRGELSLHYQPQLDLMTGQVCGMEALLRWKNPELGEVPPMEFIPVAEAAGLMDAMGEWVVDEACSQAKAWLREGLPLERMAVNVSAVQLEHPAFVERIAAALKRNDLEPGFLELELTESALLANIERARDILARVRALGVQIAIDDFGVGYSNMSYLKQLAVDRLKMDRSFVAGIDGGGKDRAVASAIIAFAQTMNLRVTAEGVEDKKQFAVLEAQRCDEIQGYYLSRPMAADKAEVFLRTLVEPQKAAG